MEFRGTDNQNWNPKFQMNSIGVNWICRKQNNQLKMIYGACEPPDTFKPKRCPSDEIFCHQQALRVVTSTTFGATSDENFVKNGNISMDLSDCIHAAFNTIFLHPFYWWMIYYSDVIISAMAFRSFPQPFVQAQIKENINALRHWPLWGGS